MSEHHKDSSPGVAQAVFDRMSPEERAEVEREAREQGVGVLEIVRGALDVLIEQSGAPSRPRVVSKPGT